MSHPPEQGDGYSARIKAMTAVERFHEYDRLMDLWCEHECCDWECGRANSLESDLSTLAQEIIYVDYGGPHD